MAMPIARKLLQFQAVRFGEEFAKLVPGDDRGNDLENLSDRISKLEVITFYLQNRNFLNEHGIDSLADLIRLGRAAKAGRQDAFRKMGGAKKAGFSEAEFHRMCKLAAEVL